jgi:putative peptidoglycan lipid II flippase
VLSFSLFVMLGAVGIAIATSLAGWINVALLVTELKRRGEFALDNVFRRSFIGIVLATVVMGLSVWWLTATLTSWFAAEKGILVQVLALLALIIGGLLTYLAAGTAFGAMKPKILLKDLLGR